MSGVRESLIIVELHNIMKSWSIEALARMRESVSIDLLVQFRVISADVVVEVIKTSIFSV